MTRQINKGRGKLDKMKHPNSNIRPLPRRVEADKPLGSAFAHRLLACFRIISLRLNFSAYFSGLLSLTF